VPGRAHDYLLFVRIPGPAQNRHGSMLTANYLDVPGRGCAVVADPDGRETRRSVDKYEIPTGDAARRRGPANPVAAKEQ